MLVKSNIKDLRSYKASASRENRGMIQHLIDIYSSKNPELLDRRERRDEAESENEKEANPGESLEGTRRNSK